MTDRFTVWIHSVAVIGAVSVTAAFWTQAADPSGFERQPKALLVFSSVFITLIVASPFILAFFPGPTLRDQRWAQSTLLIMIVIATVWMVWLVRRPVPPSGRDGIIFAVVPIFQSLVIGSIGLVSGLVRNRNGRPETTTS